MTHVVVCWIKVQGEADLESDRCKLSAEEPEGYVFFLKVCFKESLDRGVVEGGAGGVTPAGRVIGEVMIHLSSVDDSKFLHMCIFFCVGGGA